MTALSSEAVAGFDLAAALNFYAEHLATPETDLAAVRLPGGDWLALDGIAPELRGGAEGGAP